MATNGGVMLEINDRLTSRNYSTWNVRMESLLEMNDLMDIVVGMEERPQKRISKPRPTLLIN